MSGNNPQEKNISPHQDSILEDDLSLPNEGIDSRKDFRKADYHYLKSHEKRGFDPEGLQRFLDSLPGCQAEVTTHFHSSDAAGIRFSPFWWTVKFFDNLYQTLLGLKQRGHWVQILVTKLP